MMFIKPLKNLPPYLIYQMALLGQDTEELNAQVNQGRVPIALKLGSMGQIEVLYPANPRAAAPFPKTNSYFLWLQQDLELLIARDNRLLKALLIIQAKSNA